MPAAKNIVAPSEAVEKTPAPPVNQPEAAPAKVVVFWKKINPFQVIRLNDGSEIVFGQQTLATADEKLIQKITEVAKRYGILKQSNAE